MAEKPFLALCKLASEEDWCWRITCTTCGHMHFRYAFKELIKGIHPKDDNWVVHKGTPITKEIAKESNSFSEHEQNLIARLVLEVPLKEIMNVSKAPDWLGYLGLVFVHCNNFADELGKSWSAQFLEILSSSSPAYKSMEAILLGKRKFYSQDLELIEAALY